MPTGYTLSVADGKITSLAEFALEFVNVSSEPTVSDYHLKEGAELRQQLTKVLQWDQATSDKKAAKAYREAHRWYVKLLVQKNEAWNRYADMLSLVKRWDPPTQDHVELKERMIQQLEYSIESDCIRPIPIPVKLTGAEFKSQQVQDLTRSIEYSDQDHQKEVDEVTKRKEWLRALRESLPKESEQNE